jgi:hypothetical protein
MKGGVITPRKRSSYAGYHRHINKRASYMHELSLNEMRMINGAVSASALCKGGVVAGGHVVGVVTGVVSTVVMALSPMAPAAIIVGAGAGLATGGAVILGGSYACDAIFDPP